LERTVKRLEPKKAKEKILRYCVYQERSHRQVKEKLYSFGLYKNEVEDLLAELITHGFLNEERFALAYAGGKFRIKQWGRIKIKNGLKIQGITPYLINKALKEIDEQDYQDTLKNLLKKKAALIDSTNKLEIKQKLLHYAISKGYESELVWQMLNDTD
jgi:regulatory protein